jgi:DNA-binding transcriptional LysR family regulator
MQPRHHPESMNLSWLEDFLALAATGNFSRAADERHMTQPAFSRRIRALEDWIGTELFDRSSQPATLTEAGSWFRDTAEELLARVARVPDEARSIAESHSSTLRFAATHALSFTFLPGWLRGLEARTTIGPVRLVSDVLQRCEALLMQRQVQFVLSHAHPQVPGELDGQRCPSIKVGEDRLLPVSAPLPDGRARHTLGGKLCAAVPIASYSLESGIGRILHDVHGAALEPMATETVFTAHLASVLKSVVLDGRALAWLPRSLVHEELASGRLVEAASADWCIELEVRLYRDRAALGDAGERLWTAVST